MQYFELNQGSSREPFTGYKDDTHSDPEISDLIYAKVDEILSPASRMNVCFTSNSSINISPFNVSFLHSYDEIYAELYGLLEAVR